MSARAKRIAIVAIVVLIALVAVLKTVPLLLDKQKLRIAIEEGIERSTGVNFDIRELTLEATLLHGIQAHLNTSTITDMRHRPLGDIRHITVQIRYLPLLFKRTPEIAKIHIDGVYFPIAEQSIFEAIQLKLEPPEQIGFLKPARLQNAEVLVTHYLVEDLQLPESVGPLYPKARRFWLDGEKLSIKHLMSNRPVSVMAQGNLLYWLSPGQRRPTRVEKGQQLPVARFKVLVELPQALFRQDDADPSQRRDFTLRDLRRLEVSFQGADLPLDLKYRLKKDTLADATMQSGWLNLQKAEALLLQLGDTLNLPLPAGLGQWHVAGFAKCDSRVRLIYPPGPGKPDPRHIVAQADGQVLLKGVSLATPQTWPHYLVSGLTGRVGLYKDTLRFDRLAVQVGGLPLRLDGTVNLSPIRLDVRVQGKDMRLSLLKTFLQRMGVDVSALSGATLTGKLDADAHIAGPLEKPVYHGTLALHDGGYVDSAQGVGFSGVTGRIRFSGSGLRQDARLRYDGQVNLAQGRIQGSEIPVEVGKISGKISFDGLVNPAAGFQIPHYTGYLDIAQAQYQHPGTGLKVDRVQGRLNLNHRITLEHFQGYLGSALFRVEGFVSDTLKEYQLRVLASRISIPALRQELMAMLPAQDNLLVQLLQPYEGTADVNMLVSTGPVVSGTVDLNRLTLSTGAGGESIRVPRLSLRLQDGVLTLAPADIHYGEVTLALEGRLQKDFHHLAFKAPDIPMAFVRDHADLLMMLSGRALPEIWNTAGSLALEGVVDSNQTRLALAFDHAGLSWQGGVFPVYDLNGQLLFNQPRGGQPQVKTRNLAFRYGNSPVALDVEWDRTLHVVSNGVLSRLTVNHFLGNPYAVGMPYEQVPFRMAAFGTMGGLGAGGLGPKADLRAGLSLDLNPLLSIGDGPGAVGDLPAEPVVPTTRLKADAREAEEELGRLLNAREGAYFHAQLHLSGDDLEIPRASLHLSETDRLEAQGRVERLGDPAGQRAYQLHFWTDPGISLANLSAQTRNGLLQGMKGDLALDVTMLGSALGLDSVTGWLNTDHVAIPAMTVREATGRMEFEGRGGRLNVSRFRIPGVDAVLSGEANDLTELPIPLHNVRITGPLLSIASLLDFNKQIIQPVIIEKVIRAFLPPPQPGEPALPIQFRDADLVFDEVIYQNIILENFDSRFSLFGTGFMEIEDARLEAAGGRATGYFSMSPKDNNYTSLELKVADVSANALTQALLDVSNQIFGRVDGTVRFTTFGNPETDMLTNANGTVSMRVRDGRLPAIARVETLLTAANVFRGGLLGLNLNNIFRTLAVYDTDYFAEMSGDFQVAEGVMYTDNLVSDGENLDLFIQGTIGLQQGNANLLVNGLMSQDVSGVLGPIGSLSLGKILGYLPGIGSFGQRRGGLLGWIPGIGYVPGFGGPASDYSRFQVRLLGNLERAEAIRDFHWINPDTASALGE